ncbi:hypothetical protein IAQ61_002257 [Plenodomus lingam]|uniref:Uncharacterized protein n=1 Tax=Leptosphaeria maculans (strain JN3 / isolate v23.1.3 / race Av1-4-5-6-7-8) TaxID=985895 RepID=E4ZIB1_LEPMJ|nr:hypothetical protein LEMA_P058060.1 [Plenodomus lingam JN3]KAH9876896.1 hypothetical protein IAQ61_002257 [Plenodomus lingam]CBX90772.1 hypothetical protein LEMA_P058060.1 [Plenodomus lingam JN3]
MSFYVYYGKLDTELLVAVLPNGTIEHNDPIFLYTKQWDLISHKATDVKVTDESEDLVNFKDNHFTYQIVTKMAYKELTLTVKDKDGKTSKVALTRHYDQPFTALPQSDPPTIWTGAVDFHDWAKNEAFFIITPKGLGNGKPVVSVWQWTQDANKGERSLTYATGEQQSQIGTPTMFSFKHNGYYTLDCKISTKTSGLNVTIKSKTNPEAIQKEMPLAQKITIGAEHQFTPPRPAVEKITMECSYPKATSSLKRYNGALPFPADLVETLRHSAAYVDQAGYLANHAVNQFNQLDKSFQMLEKKAEARATKIIVLEDDIAKHLEANGVLDAKNKELQKQLQDYRAAAESREAKLQEALVKTKDDLTLSEEKHATAEAGRAKAEAEVKQQKVYIEKDQLSDKKRDADFAAHDKKDHDHIAQLEKNLATSRDAEALSARKLKDRDATIQKLNAEITSLSSYIRTLESTLCDRATEIAGLTATLTSTKSLLALKQRELSTLNTTLSALTTTKQNLETALCNEQYNHRKTNDSLLTLSRKHAAQSTDLDDKIKEYHALQAKLDEAEQDLRDAQQARNKWEKKARTAETDLQERNAKMEGLRRAKEAEIRELEGKVARAEREHGVHHRGASGMVAMEHKDHVVVSSAEVVGA